MEDNNSVSRRRILQLGGAGLATSLAGCSGVPGFGGQSEIDKKLQEVKEAHAKYDGNIELAIKDGFQPFGPFVPNMGLHLSNQQRSQEAAKAGEFDYMKPTILNFDSSEKLGGLEWGAPAAQMPRTPSLFEEADEERDLDVHNNSSHAFSNGNGKVDNPKDLTPDELLNNDNWAEFVPPRELAPGDKVEKTWGAGFKGQSEDNVTERIVDFGVTHPDLIGLHAWVFVDNPNGMFASFNPNFYNPE